MNIKITSYYITKRINGKRQLLHAWSTSLQAAIVPAGHRRTREQRKGQAGWRQGTSLSWHNMHVQTV